jgi:hypothetical protein
MSLAPDPYDAVNAAWPADLPVITIKDAGKMARRLWDAFASSEGAEGAKPYSYHVPRRCWGSTAQTRNSLRAGWRRMVHDVSHVMHSKVNRLRKDHGSIHADLELRLVQHVISKGWLTPKQDKPKANPRQLRYARTLAGIERWKRKLRRAQNALDKLVKQRRYYEKTLTTTPDA